MQLLTFFTVLLFILNRSRCERRIVNGRPLVTVKRYMAYLIRAPASPRTYDAWMCGAAIVDKFFLITSAACVEDIEFMYAIAGYNKYVPASKIETDDCTKYNKKKVVLTCVPKMYELDHAKVEKWSYVDIALARVETPFIFDSPTPSPFCTWVPNMIEMNFEAKHQSPDVDVMVMGWGHSEIWRKPSDTKDYNNAILQYTPTLILDKNICKTSYSAVPNLLGIIDKYMICTLGEGNLDSDGHTIISLAKTRERLDNLANFGIELFVEVQRRFERTPLKNDGCIDEGKICKRSNLRTPEAFGSIDYLFRRLGALDMINESLPLSDLRLGDDGSEYPKRNGICQNDHGGPLVTWVGGQEMLIGIASVFLVDAKDRNCVGPYLHTSTHCNSAFLACILGLFDENVKTNSTRVNRRRVYETPEQEQERKNREDIYRRYRYIASLNSKICDMPAEERGFEIVQRRISWMNHPDGPARNELPDDLIERPQIPLNNLRNTGG